jgi:uncharacterized membrane protein
MPEDKKVEKKAAASEPAQSSGSSDSNLFGMLCYLISFWVPLFVLFTDKKNDKYVAFHAYQDLLLTAVTMVYMVAMWVVFFVVSIVTSGIGGFCVLPFLFLPILVMLFMMWKAWQGEKYKLPVIGDMAEKYAR